MPKAPENLKEFNSLLKVVEFLRGPDGCPWDKEQTHSTLTRFAIEEAHELADAIDSGDLRAVRDELGDVLLQVVLHAEIARQAGEFDISDVILGLNEKMVRRHPHVFADAQADTSVEVLKNWAEIKAAEKAAAGAAGRKNTSVFDVPTGMPALLRAFKIGEKTRKVDFDWENSGQCWLKVQEELGELEEVLAEPAVDAEIVDAVDESKERIESELGDLLFSLAQLARHLEIDPEQALRKTNQRFERRFAKMQDLVAAAGRLWTSLSADEKEKFWKQGK